MKMENVVEENNWQPIRKILWMSYER